VEGGDGTEACIGPSGLLLQARKFGKAMKAPVIFTSASHSINIQKMFKVGE
jgi:hypothetical protein